MQPLTQKVEGILYRRGDSTGLLLTKAAGNLYLRFAFIIQGTEKLLFPALALDDWGRERNALSLYRWVYQEGQRFPRAEVFGFTASGQETQLFLRDLEIFFNYPCYAYAGRKSPVSEGVRLDVIFVEAGQPPATPEKIPPPTAGGWPLRHAAVNWQKATAPALAAAGWQELDLSGNG